MNEDELADEELARLEDIINNKIEVVRGVLQEEDRAIVEEIVMKKSHSTDPSTHPDTQSTPSTTRRTVTTRSSGRCTSTTRS